MSEDTSLATIALIFLGISSVGCCVGAWFKLRREETENYSAV